MNVGLYRSAVAMAAQQRRMDAIAANLANLGTVGFKRGVTSTHEVEVQRKQGLVRGVTTRAEVDFAQGNLQRTGRDFDLALYGDGFFAVESADLRLERLDGEIDIAGSSGDIAARDIRGSWVSEFASGDCHLVGFDGSRLAFHAASGDLVAHDVRADRLETETASGDVTVSGDVQEFDADSASGETPTSFGSSTSAMPTKPKTMPSQRMAEIRSRMIRGANNAVSTGCKPAIRPETPAGRP